MAFIYVRNDSPEYGEMAALLVAMTEEAGLHTREIITTPHGFEVPDVVSNQLIPGAWAPLDPRSEGKVPPAGWDEPLAEVNVEQDDDGKFYLIDVLADDGAPVIEDVKPDAKPESSAIRAWAKENGVRTPERGRVPQAIIDAYFEANSAE